jgi:hypothetical protein
VDFDINDIQPRLRKTVTWLRSLGFKTCDSGDGVINVEAGMEGALDIPHVAMAVDSDKMKEESHRLYDACLLAGISGKIEVSYDPADGVAILMLYDVLDDCFPPV